jgi:integrase
MSIYDRWHRTHPSPGDEPCAEHSRGRTKLYPTTGHGKGDRWQVRWRDEAGRQRKRNFARRDGIDPGKYASAFDAKVKTELDTGTSLDLVAGRTRVRDYAARYRDDLLHRESTAERMERTFRLHVDPLPLGNLPMTQVRASHMRAWVKDRAQVLAPSTLAVVWSYLTSMFSAAVIDRVIGVSPCNGVKLPEVPRHQHYIPSADQVHALAATMAGRYSSVIYLAAGCGLRAAEITGLEVGSLDSCAARSRSLSSLSASPARNHISGRPRRRHPLGLLNFPPSRRLPWPGILRCSLPQKSRPGTVPTRTVASITAAWPG